MPRYVKKEFNVASASWTAPAGVTSIKLSVIDNFTSMFNGSRNTSTSMNLRRNGAVFGTGLNTSFQIGLGVSSANVSSLNATIGGQSFVQLATSTDGTSLALRADGVTYAWGTNSQWQVGNGAVPTLPTSSPVLVAGSHSFVQLSAGDSSYGLKSDGSVWAWGPNTDGQLGDGTRVTKSSPIAVIGGHSFCKIAGFQTSAIALKTDGSLWTWGNGLSGQLADGTILSKSSPVQAIGGHSFVDITAGLLCAYGIKSNGTVWGWGDNTSIPGVLGDGSLTNKSVPTQVAVGYSFTQFTAGTGHVLALQADGTAWGWGWNTGGQVGDGTGVNKSSPVAVSGGHSFAQINAANASWASKTDGTVWNWGANTNGQLGDGTLVPKFVPTQLITTLTYQAGSILLYENNLKVVPGTSYNISAFLTQIGTQVINNVVTGNTTTIVIEYIV